MASFIILPMSVVLQLEAALILVGEAALLWGFAALMLLGALILLRMGLAGFNREQLLAREAGLKHPLRRGLGAARQAFRDRPGLPRLLPRRLAPIGISAYALLAGAGTGYLAGASHALPSAIVRPVLSTLIAESTAGDRFQLALQFFGHNLLALLLAALLAPLTVGLTGAALTFLPGFLLGFAAASSSWGLALSGILPNGLVEVPAALVAGGLLVHVGASVIHMDRAGGWSRRVLQAEADYLRALAWLAPALLVAAFLEAYIG
jgi:uncharacterized membrane protein SpoIIM required for sporulation